MQKLLAKNHQTSIFQKFSTDVIIELQAVTVHLMFKGNLDACKDRIRFLEGTDNSPRELENKLAELQ